MRAPEFWSADTPLSRLLVPLGSAYDLAGRLRRRVVRAASVAPPVICAGNLVAGGAGKTPVAISIIKRLAARGLRVHALTRGHGGRLGGPLRVDPAVHGAAEVGDEALLLARHAPTWVARDRAAGARGATAAGAEAIVLDDGFQNPSLAKDLSLLVIDGGFGLGNRRVLPAGPLREAPERALARAGAVVLIGADRAGVEAWLTGRRPLVRAELVPGPEGAELAGRRVLAFAGIGRPEKFFATLDDLGAEVVERRSFPDHHPYGDKELATLLDRAAALDAVAVTTEKDAARLSPADRRLVTVLPVALEWRDPVALDRLLDGVLGHG